MRQLVGYDRLEGQRAYRQLAELYRAVRLYVNFFQPSLKPLTKRRTGAHVSRTYHPAQTPFQRLVTSGVLSPTARQRLENIYRALDPVRLLRQLETLQDALWRRAAVLAARQTEGLVVLVPRIDGQYARVGTVAHIEESGRLPDGRQASVFRGQYRLS